MSRAKHSNLRPHKRTRQETDTAVSNLNARIVQLSDHTLPKQPYLLSVPSERPYRYSRHFAQTWYVGTPFTRREEQLQYLSFLPHNGEYEDLLKVEGAWADDDGNYIDDEHRPQPSQSVPGTPLPSEQVGRKKISLKDYKKEKGQIEGGDTPLKTPEPKQGKSTAVKHEGSIKREGEPNMPETSPPGREENHERGRSPVRAADRKPAIPQYDGPTATTSKVDLESPRPLKKRRLSQSPPPKKRRLSESPPPKSQLDKSQPPKKLPKLLSPTLPSSPHRNNDLPELLSPELPPSLMRALATPPSTNSSDSNKAHGRSDSVRSILGTINEDGPRSSDKNGLNASTGGSRVRSDSQHSNRSGVSVSGAISRPGLKTGATTPNRSPGPRQRHIIVLKYGKKNRKTVQALLKFKSQPKKPVKPASTAEVPKQDAPKSSVLKEPQKLNSERNTSPDRPTSKSKPPLTEPIKRPSTPLMNGIKDAKRPVSPVTTTKSITATPKREIKSTAMRRVESVEGLDPSTPKGVPRASTPASIERSRIPKSSPLPSSAAAPDLDERSAWQKLDKERGYFALARKLKHEGTSLLDAAKSSSEQHKPLLLLVETLLGFMLHNTVQSYVHGPRRDAGWSTIIGYYTFIHGRTRHFPHLHGLVIQMGAVCRQQIHNANLARLSRYPLPSEEHTGAAPTPGSDGTTKAGPEDAETSRRQYVDFRTELIKNADQLNDAWLEGSRLLSAEVLMKEYPETWKARNKDFEHRGAGKYAPRSSASTGTGSTLARGYYLPIDPASSPFEAVEYALKVLNEWADRDDVDWRARLPL